MAVVRISAADILARSETSLGLSATGEHLLSDVGIAASVRRAASFLCPTTPATLRRAVEQSLRGLGQSDDELRHSIDTTLTELVGIGDLLVLRVDSGAVAAQQVFLGTPAFVANESGAFLIGVRPEGAPLVTPEVAHAVEHYGHVRWVWWERDYTAAALLAEGLLSLREDQWLQAPRERAPGNLVAEFRGLVDRSAPLDLIDGMSLLDTQRPVTYYRGRWRDALANDTGVFVVRRPQAYGADLWCLSVLAGDGSMRILDLPIDNPLSSGADEAWRLQAALDRSNGSPQIIRIHALEADEARLDLFSPLPSWAQRHMALTGTSTPRGKGALFSYVFPVDRVDEEVEFLERMLWMTVEPIPE